MSAPRLEFAVLGPIEVRRQGEPVSLGGARMRALLALLLARGQSGVAADELLATVWAEALPKDPTNALQACISRLRRTVGREVVESVAGGYRIKIEPGQLDAEVFERLVQEGRSCLAADDAVGAEAAFDRALAIWRGRAFADLPVNALKPVIRRLEELRLSAFEGRVDAVLRLGGGPELVSDLTALVHEQPLRERLGGQLALALYRSERQADALEVCRTTSHALREVGLEPGRQLRELERAILRHDPALGVPVPRLPVPANPLLGRERELEEAIGCLRRQEVRLLTLTGPGGIGKTRLALEVARELGEAVFVDLANTRESALVLGAIASAAGVPRSHGQSAGDSLELFLRDRETLLVLDSFEHVVEAASELSRLLAAAPQLKLLITSRTVLRLVAEHEYPVGPLRESEAVRLFQLRAEAINPSFRVGAGEVESVAEICRRLDGIPLAIELAAARTKVLRPAAMAERLATGSDFLSSGRRDAPERHQTLRATLDWSYALLEPAERVVLQQLAVFVGGFNLNAAEAVCADRATLSRIEALVDKSLIQRDGADRFRLLDTIQEYALERLGESAAVDAQVRLRHAQHYLALLEGADAELLGPGERQALARFELEHGNIRAGFGHALSIRDVELALRFAAACRRFWYADGHLSEGLETLKAALGLDRAAAPALRAGVLNGTGILAAELGDYDAARGFFEESARLARSTGQRGLLADAIGNCARMAMFEDDHERAEALLEEARRTGGEYANMISLENLAEIASAQGDFDRALTLAEEAFGLARRSGSPRIVANMGLAVGRIRLAREEVAESDAALHESLVLWREVDDPRGTADCVEALGELAAACGNGERAATLFGAASSLRRSVGAVQSPERRARYSHYIELAREAVGTAAFDDAFALAAQTPLEEVIAADESVQRTVGLARTPREAVK